MRRYTESNEWVELNGQKARVGLCQKAVERIGEIVFVVLPEEQEAVKRQDPVAVVESTKAAIDLYAPLSGRVSEVNKKLVDHCDLINQSAESEGWLYTLELSHPLEFDLLLKEPPCKQ